MHGNVAEPASKTAAVPALELAAARGQPPAGEAEDVGRQGLQPRAAVPATEEQGFHGHAVVPADAPGTAPVLQPASQAGRAEQRAAGFAGDQNCRLLLPSTMLLLAAMLGTLMFIAIVSTVAWRPGTAHYPEVKPFSPELAEHWTSMSGMPGMVKPLDAKGLMKRTDAVLIGWPVLRAALQHWAPPAAMLLETLLAVALLAMLMAALAAWIGMPDAPSEAVHEPDYPHDIPREADDLEDKLDPELPDTVRAPASAFLAGAHAPSVLYLVVYIRACKASHAR